jgi:hypothetical protein
MITIAAIFLNIISIIVVFLLLEKGTYITWKIICTTLNSLCILWNIIILIGYLK